MRKFLQHCYRSRWRVIVLFLIGLLTLNYIFPSITQRPVFWFMYSRNTYPLLINTSACKIPDFPLYDAHTRYYTFMAAPPPVSCKRGEEREFWTRLQFDCNGESRIRILPPLDPEEWSEVECGYQVITRANESAGRDRDWRFNVSPVIPVPRKSFVEGFDPAAEFVQVRCNYSGREYVEYHATPILANNPRRGNIQRKLDFWKGKEEELPPNILFIGHDSTTRLSFRRHGKEMVKFLESIGAHEMKGYVTAGENTFPNLVPLLTGYTVPEYESACITSWTTDFQDNCPLLFSKLDKLGYITAFLEDSPEMAIFHWMKLGFFNQTVDFNSRPLLLSAENSPPSCPGTAQFLLDYLTRITTFARQRAPLFGFYFFTADTHGPGVGGLQHADHVYTRFLASMDLSNTVLFVFGDHGLRFGPVAQLMLGQFEGSLPNMWVRLGEKVRRKFPEWEEALKLNELRIFSSFNTYWTINKVLDSYAEKPAPLQDAVEIGTGVPIKRNRYISFFEPQREDANCSDIGVPLAFCPCGGLEVMMARPALSVSAAKLALKEINLRLKNFPCEELNLVVKEADSELVGGAFMNEKKSMLVMFGTKPGNAQIQARVELVNEETPVKLLATDRVNRINKTLTTPCASKLTSWAELFCVCKP